MNYDIDEIIKKTSTIMMFDQGVILDYNEVVEHYIILLNHFLTLDPSKIMEDDLILQVNYSFNFCTGEVLDEYYPLWIDLNTIEEKKKKNLHFSQIITIGDKLISKIYNDGQEDLAISTIFDIYLVGHAVYNFENRNVKTKKFS